MKSFIKILILLCLAHLIPIIAMEEAEKMSSQSANLAEDILPNELWTMILPQVYFNENICLHQNISEALDSIKQELPKISKNIRLVCRTFNFLNKSIGEMSYSKDKLKEFYRSLLIKKFPRILNDIIFIKTKNNTDIIFEIISICSKDPKIDLDKAIALLLFFGPNVNDKDIKGNSVLHAAIPMHLQFNNNLAKEVIGALLDHGADINIQNNYGNTALHSAISSFLFFGKRHTIEIIKILLDRGANLTITNNDGDTPIDLAKRSTSNELKELLGCPDESWNCILM